MQRITSWIKNNKLALILLAVILFLVYTNRPIPLFTKQYESLPTAGGGGDSVSMESRGVSAPTADFGSSQNSKLNLIAPDYEPVSPSQNRMVIQESNLSVLVKDVRETGDKVLKYANENGGFMVSSSYSRPEESPFATISVRIPTDKFTKALEYYRSLGIKVTNENLYGNDVTEQYEDLDSQIETLEKTKTKFEELLSKATEVQDILQVQRELTNIQSQIDSYKGRKESLANNAKLTKITLYLSTDELALPYTPEKSFRPNIIFKLAVRSLVGSLRNLAEAAIWIGVYSVVWLPVLLVIIFLKRRSQKSQKNLQ